MGAVESCCGGGSELEKVDRSSSRNTNDKKPVIEASGLASSVKGTQSGEKDKVRSPQTQQTSSQQTLSQEEQNKSEENQETNISAPPQEVKKNVETKKEAPPVPQRSSLKSLNNAKASVSSKEQENIAEVSDMLSQIESLQQSLGGKSDRVPAVVKQINTKKKAEERMKALKFSKKSGDASHDAEVLVYICGDGGVGKTCVATSFAECGYFDGDALPTMFDTKDVFCTFLMNEKPVRVKLRIVDTAGQEGIYKTFFDVAKGAVTDFAKDKTCDRKGIVFFLCYSAAGNTKAEKRAAETSFKNTQYDPSGESDCWVEYIDRVANEDNNFVCKSTSIMLVGTKDDANDDEQRVVKEAEVIKACEKLQDDLEGDYKVEHGYCSALLDYDSVKKLFSRAAALALN